MLAANAQQTRVAQLVNAYRVRGHLFADLDPLDITPPGHPELELANFGLTEADLDTDFSTAGMCGLPERATLRQIVDAPARDVLLDHRRRVHAHRGAGAAPLAAGADGVDAQPCVARPHASCCASSRS